MYTSPLVFILVLNYNGGETLFSCLRSIFQLEYPFFRVVVLDNNSRDSSFELAKQRYSQAHFIRNSENVGFARGMNIGIQFALEHGAEFIWLVNPDVIVPPQSLRDLVGLLERNATIGMASPLITTASQHRRVWFGGGKIQWTRMRAIHTKLRSRSMSFETGFLSGCALFVRKSLFQTAGLFDERFFLYYEDADLSLRAEKAGFQIVVYPKVIVTHSEESRKNPDKTYWLVRSGLSFFRKYTPFFLIPFFWIIFWIRRLWSILRSLHSHNHVTNSVRKAFRDFWTYGY